MTDIRSLEALRALYREPSERSLRKQLDRLDEHCRRFVALSPFLVIASTDAEGRMDASPRGGDPGFVKVLDAHTVLIPDSPGNNRLDSMQNLIDRPGVGLLFMIPGVDETLRINGRAGLRTDDALIELCAHERRRPRLVIAVKVQEAYLHCAKALKRSKLWDPATRVERGALPSLGKMILDQAKSAEPVAEVEARIEQAYREKLY